MRIFIGERNAENHFPRVLRAVDGKARSNFGLGDRAAEREKIHASRDVWTVPVARNLIT
jgi:hypothetical protein